MATELIWFDLESASTHSAELSKCVELARAEETNTSVVWGVPVDRPNLLIWIAGWSAHKPESYVAAFNGEMKSLGATIKSHLHILFPKSPSEMLSPENPVLEIVQVILSESTADKEYTDVVHTIFEGSEHQVSKPLESEGDKARTYTTVAVWPSVEAAKASKERPAAVEARGKLRSMCSGFVGHVQIADPQKA